MAEIIIRKPAGKKRIILFVCLILAIMITVLYVLLGLREQKRVHSARDFGFEDVKCGADADGDGIDDYADMVAGARAYIATDPEYVSAYYAGGYPDEGEGVCTDVIWHAFAAAGYTLKDMVDADVSANREAYPEATDSNINFRRVRNLRVFFARNAQTLTTSLRNPKDWMPGDIVIYDGHIALCSDKRNADGLPYIIHHGNNVDRAHEGNELASMKIVGHYRFVP